MESSPEQIMWAIIWVVTHLVLIGFLLWLYRDKRSAQDKKDSEWLKRWNASSRYSSARDDYGDDY
jgi:hypothetical protein